jgi:hypothetical protein
VLLPANGTDGLPSAAFGAALFATQESTPSGSTAGVLSVGAPGTDLYRKPDAGAIYVFGAPYDDARMYAGQRFMTGGVRAGAGYGSTFGQP